MTHFSKNDTVLQMELCFWGVWVETRAPKIPVRQLTPTIERDCGYLKLSAATDSLAHWTHTNKMKTDVKSCI